MRRPRFGSLLVRPALLGCCLLLPFPSVLPAADKPEPQVTVTGRVVDADGRPAPGIDVEVHGYKDQSEATTDKTGQFSVEFPAARLRGAMVLAKSADGGRMGFFRLPYEPDAANEPVTLTLKPSQRLMVQVNDGDGRPIANARTGVIAEYHPWDSQLTDDTGQSVHTFPADATLLNVYAWKPATGIDYHTFYDPRKVPQDGPPPKPDLSQPFTLVLSDPITVDVKVVDVANDQPLAGTAVYPWYLQKPDQPDDLNLSFLPDQVSVKTDAEGLARFDWLPSWNESQSITFWPMRDDYVRQRAMYDPANVGGELTISLHQLVPISGRVRLPNGEPAPEITIEARGRGYTSDDFRHSVQTDVEGRYEFRAAPNMVYLLVVADEKWAAPPQTGFALMPGEPRENVDFNLQPATRLFGRVTMGKDEKPVVGQSVQSYQSGMGIHEIPGAALPNPEDSRNSTRPYYVRSTKTDAEGRYELFVGPGKYDIRGPSQNEIEKFEITNETEREFNFHTPREERGRLTGRVVTGAPPRPVPHAKVWGVSLYSLAGLDLDITADENGRFDVERDLHATVLRGRSPDGQLAGMIEIGPDETDVTISIEPTGSLTGRLVHPDTEVPVAGREIACQVQLPLDGKNGPFRRAFGGKSVTDADGRFQIQQLTVGIEFNVTLANPDRRSWNRLLEITPPTSEPIELGDVRLPSPQDTAYTVPALPTLQDRIAEAFENAEDSPADRLQAALRDARIGHVPVLLIVGDPEHPAIEQFFAARDENRSLRNVLFDYRVLALSTAGNHEPAVQTLGREKGLYLDDAHRRPRLVVLSAEGERVAQVALTDLQQDDTLDQTKLTFLLSQHRLPPLDARALLDDALAQAKVQNKRVFVQETASWCGPCWRLSRFLDDHRDLLGKDYLHVKVDQRWKHADEVMQGIRTSEGGIPWYAILDADGKVLANSDGPDGNIGFPGPHEPDGIAHFLKTLRETATRLSADELGLLKADLENR